MDEKVMETESVHCAEAERRVFIRDELGLHARPAARLAQAAQRFESSITLEYDNMQVDGKSILDILSLSAGRGSQLVIRCRGRDAGRAAEQLAELFF